MSFAPRTTRSVHTVAGSVVVFMAVACTHATRPVDSAWSAPGRLVVDAPARFVTTDANDIDGAPASGCASRLVDRRYGIELQLVRAATTHDAQWRGDYRAATPARYDVADGELLRVECATGVPLGVVPGTVTATGPIGSSR